MLKFIIAAPSTPLLLAANGATAVDGTAIDNMLSK